MNDKIKQIQQKVSQNLDNVQKIQAIDQEAAMNMYRKTTEMMINIVIEAFIESGRLPESIDLGKGPKLVRMLPLYQKLKLFQFEKHEVYQAFNQLRKIGNRGSHHSELTSTELEIALHACNDYTQTIQGWLADALVRQFDDVILKQEHRQQKRFGRWIWYQPKMKKRLFWLGILTLCMLVVLSGWMYWELWHQPVYITIDSSEISGIQLPISIEFTPKRSQAVVIQTEQAVDLQFVNESENRCQIQKDVGVLDLTEGEIVDIAAFSTLAIKVNQTSELILIAPEEACTIKIAVQE